MERSVVTTCLIICLTLGFVSLFVVYLPNQMANPIPSPVSSPSLSDVVADIPPEQKPFEEEASPAAPVVEEQRPAGDGVAVEEPAPPPIAEPVEKKDKPQKFVRDIPEHFPLKMYEPLPEVAEWHFEHGFKITPKLKPAFEFWRNVYARYDQSQAILHDNRNLDIIYGVLDFSALEDNIVLDPQEKRKLRNKVEEEKKKELTEMLMRFENGEMPATAGEHIVYGFFENSNVPKKFERASERLRSQWGQKNRFQEGFVRAGRYMPMMEELFIREGVPKEISKLVFVESMFQLGATSKVGAGGPWQFMPATARLYMTLNDIVDERRDPLIAAQSAAKLLHKNYDLVGSWPLAINGYNTGILRMSKAARQLGTKDIGTIIERFDDPGYQFASRNFYPEFLAALDVATHHKEYFGELELESPIPFDEIVLPYHTCLHQFSEAIGTDVGVIQDLNPAYHEKNFSPGALVPKGYTLRVPHQQKMICLAALDQLQSRERETRLHIVGKKESLQQIASRYQIPVGALKETNGLISNNLKTGQLLKIPGPPTEVVLEAH
ncbi:MAG: transglycosylase SLT domain-containing protein [Deltaproteobacteria bacterium]|nr:transglycosylase SLT domain-containing protein [Deltaproteobacteria bacterium]